MKLLLAIEEAEIRQIAAFCLGKIYNAQVVEASSIESVQEQIRDGADYSLVISDFPGWGEEVSKLLESKNLAIKADFGLLTYSQQGSQVAQKKNWSFPVARFLDCKSCIQQSIDYLESMPGGSPEKNNGTNEFEDVHAQLLLRASPLPADVYIRLGDAKYVRLFAENDFFGTEDFEKYYVTKNVKSLYYKQPETIKFIASLKSAMATMEPPPKPIPDTEESVAATVALTKDNVLDRLAGLVDGIPVDAETQEVVNKSVKEVVKLMGATPKLKNILNSLVRDKDKYITSHSLMVSNIACAIAKGLQWGSEATFMKLTMAAFLHDCAIASHKLAEVKDLVELEARKSEFTPDDVNIYKNHPLVAAELAKSFYEIPKDVDMIIVQHHERPDGSGFPKGLTHSRMHPMAAVFIIAHDAVDFYYAQKDNGPFDHAKFIEAYDKIYVGANFKKALRSMSDMMKAKG